MRRKRLGTTTLPAHPTTEERFWAKVDKQGPIPAHRPELGPCWPWTGAVPKRSGYGRFNTGVKRAGHWVVVNAHRYSWKLHNGPVPDGLCVLHRCDNKPCVRPDHLFVGTKGDNNRDMVAKGRHWRQAGRQGSVGADGQSPVRPMATPADGRR